MTKLRRSFTDEFKREAVALLQSSGRPLMQIADELGIQPSMLRNWRNAVGVPAGASSRPDTQATPPQAGSPGDQSAEIARLRREVGTIVKASVQREARTPWRQNVRRDPSSVHRSGRTWRRQPGNTRRRDS